MMPGRNSRWLRSRAQVVHGGAEQAPLHAGLDLQRRVGGGDLLERGQVAAVVVLAAELRRVGALDRTRRRPGSGAGRTRVRGARGSCRALDLVQRGVEHEPAGDPAVLGPAPEQVLGEQVDVDADVGVGAGRRGPACRVAGGVGVRRACARAGAVGARRSGAGVRCRPWVVLLNSGVVLLPTLCTPPGAACGAVRSRQTRVRGGRGGRGNPPKPGVRSTLAGHGPGQTGRHVTHHRRGPRRPPERTFFGQPFELSTPFAVELWERFSFYGMQGIVLIYMYYTVTQGGLGIDQDRRHGDHGRVRRRGLPVHDPRRVDRRPADRRGPHPVRQRDRRDARAHRPRADPRGRRGRGRPRAHRAGLRRAQGHRHHDRRRPVHAARTRAATPGSRCTTSA